MKNIKISILFVAIAAFAVGSFVSGCAPEPTYYSQVTPELFFDSKQKVYQRAGRPFTHWAWALTDATTRAPLVKFQEFTTDAMVFPTRYSDWSDGGRFDRWYHHELTPRTEELGDTWRAVAMGIAQAWSAKEDIDTLVDADALGMSEAELAAISYELQALAAFFYLNGLDMWGGMPLYENNQGEALPRSTEQETFDYIEKLLTEALPNLPKKALGQAETGHINQAAAAMMLMRLYFNSEAYTGVEMFDEAAEMAQNVIDGDYGAYALEDDWTDIFGYENHMSTEIIWSVPSEYNVSERMRNPQSSPYKLDIYWGISDVGGRDNGFCLTPSLDVNGKSYVHPSSIYGNTDPSPKGTFRLGSPFAKFHDTDVRKQLYAYGPATGQWRGQFLMGELINPVTGAACYGQGERQVPPDRVVVLVDQLARIGPSSYEKGPDGKPDYSKPVYDKDHGKEGLVWAEEESGIRLTKFSPVPNEADRSLLWDSDFPVIRLAEAYYTLAECKLRAGDKTGAAELINTVRERYFTGADPQAVTVATLDEWRMLDEWMIEFLGEGRRRTDLVRWDKFTTEAWWDHEASSSHINRFPIPQDAISGNPLLEQNDGYAN